MIESTNAAGVVPKNDALADRAAAVVVVAAMMLSFRDSIRDMRETATGAARKQVAELQPVALAAREAIAELQLLIRAIERRRDLQPT